MARKWTRATLLDPASDWVAGKTKDTVHLWHGCTTLDLASIVSHGIDLRKCQVDTDFGQGFYLTSIRRQARHWAWLRYFDLKPRVQRTERPVMLRFELLREALGRLASISFVSGAYENDGYWSLVQHCRLSPPYPNHHRHEYSANRDRMYDVVSGPVAAHWYQRMADFDSDQFSFHTRGGDAALAGLDRRAESAERQGLDRERTMRVLGGIRGAFGRQR
jgi:hypothetical protein